VVLVVVVVVVVVLDGGYILFQLYCDFILTWEDINVKAELITYFNVDHFNSTYQV